MVVVFPPASSLELQPSHPTLSVGTANPPASTLVSFRRVNFMSRIEARVRQACFCSRFKRAGIVATTELPKILSPPISLVVGLYGVVCSNGQRILFFRDRCHIEKGAYTHVRARAARATWLGCCDQPVSTAWPLLKNTRVHTYRTYLCKLGHLSELVREPARSPQLVLHLLRLVQSIGTTGYLYYIPGLDGRRGRKLGCTRVANTN